MEVTRRYGANPTAYDALMSPDRGWTSDPGVVFALQVLWWIAVQDGGPVRMYAESLGQRWFDSTEARLLAESRQAQEESYSFPPYCDPLFSTGTGVCTPLGEVRQEYITQAAEQLCLHDERQLRRAIDVFEGDGWIELIDQRMGADSEGFESVGNWFRRYSMEELRGISRKWSQGSLRSTANDARWNQSVVLTQKGHTMAGALRQAYANDVGRRNAARDALLDYLHRGNHPILWVSGFEQDPHGFYMGQRFRPNDCHDAARYLLEKDLVRKRSTRTLLGDTVEITGKGIDCIEKHAGSVSSFLNNEEVRVRDIYNVGQAAAVGPGARADYPTMIQFSIEGADAQQLVSELAILRAELKKRSTNAEHDLVIGEVAYAELAVGKGDTPSVRKHLAQAGKWALDVATSIGTTLASAAIKAAMGIQ